MTVKRPGRELLLLSRHLSVFILISQLWLLLEPTHSTQSDEENTDPDGVPCFWKLVSSKSFLYMKSRLHPLQRMAMIWTEYDIKDHACLSISGQKIAYNHHQKYRIWSNIDLCQSQGICKHIPIRFCEEYRHVRDGTDVLRWCLCIRDDHRVLRKGVLNNCKCVWCTAPAAFTRRVRRSPPFCICQGWWKELSQASQRVQLSRPQVQFCNIPYCPYIVLAFHVSSK